ncbi:dipeptide/oligopeptide/nickel ABC transporter permease/ATP-binding protein [Streptomyces sp. TRM66268-LWL]|uniref:Dipeptide/oligopeptide/nickel ABC transporter permease/ATP-binding protein n=2 Tax=Streptomyces polyasparticus TaxID=2767826 RepID=A0ABR7S861_9ACTN|nr:dipeptide/oligopeptide/nickel ABC transporter permease/ATP-binding protein [Streptomyces polyasparticus]
MQKLRRSPALMLGLAGLAFFVVLGIVAPFIWTDRAETLTDQTHLAASAEHWFGTDALGRDIFARTMVATRLTLLMCLATTAIAAVGGIGFGAAIWVGGPRVRALGQRVIDVLISYPSVIFALAMVAILGPGVGTSIVAIGLATCPAFARLTTNLAASIAGRDFVSTARLLGVPPSRLLRRHILPNIAEPLLVLLSVAFTVSLKALSGLSFLGVGVQAPDYDWGAVLHKGLEGIYLNPWPALGPSLVIILAGLSGGLIGDGLAAAVNPAAGRKRGYRAKVEALTSVPAYDAHDEDALAVADRLSVVLPDGTRLVDEVSFAIKPSEVLGLVGESGSGKSLTAMALAKLLPDDLTAVAGTLKVGDLDLNGRPPAGRLATEIGIVYQDPSASFNPTLKLGGQLTETLRKHGGASRAAAAEQAVGQLAAARVTLPEQRLKQYPYELSGGMRQRAMIASALLTSPKLLIADEPTTALDVTVQAEVLGLLREANERDGTAILLISHDVGVISAICDRVVVMYAGRIVETLPIERLRAGEAEHPYTHALLAATPTLHSPVDEPLSSIPGRPPHPAGRPAGCAFASRCPLARQQCHDELPVLTVTDTGATACHALHWDKEVLA